MEKKYCEYCGRENDNYQSVSISFSHLGYTMTICAICEHMPTNIFLDKTREIQKEKFRKEGLTIQGQKLGDVL